MKLALYVGLHMLKYKCCCVKGAALDEGLR